MAAASCKLLRMHGDIVSVDGCFAGTRCSFRFQLLENNLYADTHMFDQFGECEVRFILVIEFVLVNRGASDFGEIAEDFLQLSCSRAHLSFAQRKSRKTETKQKPITPERERADSLDERDIVIGKERIKL